MTEYATVFEFDSAASRDNPQDVALLKDVEPCVVYYKMSVRYYKNVAKPSEPPVWELHKRPVFKKKRRDSLVFYFIDSQQDADAKVDAVGVVIEFNQEIGPFADEVAAAIRMAGPWPETFRKATGAESHAFELKPKQDEEAGFPFENAGKYSYTVALITFPDRRLYFHDPEMDVDT